MKRGLDTVPRKIVFFSRDLKIGGMEKALVSLLNELAKQNYQITLVLEKKEGVLLKRLNEGIVVKEYSLSQCPFVPLRRVLNLLHRVFWGILHYHRYDFSCNYATYSAIGSKLALLASPNNALYVHSNYPALYQGDRAQIESFFHDNSMKAFQHVIFVSKESVESTKAFFPSVSERFCVINNIVDYRNILNDAEHECDVFKNDKINFLFVGRLDDSSKHFDLLIDSFKTASDRSKKICLTLIGDGPDRFKIQKRIAEEKIEGIRLLGEKENPYPFIKNCDCLIMTSKYEGYPVIYTEALVLNKMFITTVPVSDDFIDVRNHFIICRPNQNEIADQMLKIEKSKTDYYLDFEAANAARIDQFDKIICRSVYEI